MDLLMKLVVFCCIVTLVPHINATYGYSQPDPNANVTPQLPQAPQPTYNVPYPPKSAYNYPQLVPVQKPSVLYIDPPSYPSVYGADQLTSTTTAAPSGIWKIFSEFSLPNWFGRHPEETSTDYSVNPYGYPPSSPAPYPYSQPNAQSSYYNYAVFQQQSPSGAPPTGNYQYYQSYSKYPLYQVPAPGSKTPVLPPVPRYPSNYYNNYPYALTPSPYTVTPTTPSLTTSSGTSSPVSQYPSISKPAYPQQPQLPAYSIYLVPAKPAYYPQNPQAQPNPSYVRPPTYQVQDGSMGGYYASGNRNPFYPVTPTPTPTVLTTTSKPSGSDCNTTTTATTMAYSTPYVVPIDIRYNEKRDNEVDTGTTTSKPTTTTTTATTTTNLPTTTIGPIVTDSTDSSTERPAQARYLSSQGDQENWVPLMPTL